MFVHISATAVARAGVSRPMSAAGNFKFLKNVLDDYPIWKEYLVNVCGVGEAMGGVIISEIDITRAKYPSIPSGGNVASSRLPHFI